LFAEYRMSSEVRFMMSLELSKNQQEGQGGDPDDGGGGDDGGDGGGGGGDGGNGRSESSSSNDSANTRLRKMSKRIKRIELMLENMQRQQATTAPVAQPEPQALAQLVHQEDVAQMARFVRLNLNKRKTTEQRKTEPFTGEGHRLVSDPPLPTLPAAKKGKPTWSGPKKQRQDKLRKEKEHLKREQQHREACSAANMASIPPKEERPLAQAEVIQECEQGGRWVARRQRFDHQTKQWVFTNETVPLSRPRNVDVAAIRREAMSRNARWMAARESTLQDLAAQAAEIYRSTQAAPPPPAPREEPSGHCPPSP
jgi:hypothetical protein